MSVASKVKIQEEIISSIKEAAHYVYDNTGINLRKMPEYYLNVVIAESLCDKFPNLGFRLEMQVRELMQSHGISKCLNESDLRMGGNFDIALLSNRSKKVRHIIEVKRTLSKSQIKK